MGRITRIKRKLFKRLGRTPGNSIIAQTLSAFGIARDTQIWSSPGYAGSPTPEDRAVEIEVGSGRRVIIATKNYRVEVDPDAGESVIYSTDANGDTESARVHCKQDGEIEAKNGNGSVVLTPDGYIDLNGNGRTLVTHAELNTALQSMLSSINTTFGTKQDASGSPGTVTLNISNAEAQTLRTGL